MSESEPLADRAYAALQAALPDELTWRETAEAMGYTGDHKTLQRVCNRSWAKRGLAKPAGPKPTKPVKPSKSAKPVKAPPPQGPVGVPVDELIERLSPGPQLEKILVDMAEHPNPRKRRVVRDDEMRLALGVDTARFAILRRQYTGHNRKIHGVVYWGDVKALERFQRRMDGFRDDEETEP